MRSASGVFNGTGATVYIGLGFVPDHVKLLNLEATAMPQIEWHRKMTSAEQVGGILGLKITDADTADGGGGGGTNLTALVEATGVIPYFGQDGPLAAVSTSYLVNSEGNHIPSSVQGPHACLWTLDTSANRTGSLNAGVDTDYVGEGSKIQIKQSNGKTVEAQIMVCTNDGDADDEIELDRVVSSGEVLGIGPMYTFRGAAKGVVVPAGFSIVQTTLNASGNMVFFHAWCDD
jgi:hypothetical protein